MNVSILGSTGSIGTQTLEVIRELNARGADINVLALSAGSNAKLLAEQAREFNVRYLCIDSKDGSDLLREMLKDMEPVIFTGEEGLREIASVRTDIIVTAVVGMRGLVPTMNAIKAGNNIALANKETLVAAGNIVMEAAGKNGVNIFPVDSEHCAVKQCLDGGRYSDVKKIVLTASGGPFRGKKREEIKNVTVKEALSHPTWKMGGKITIDSATLMNKGLEVIEAMHLFNVGADRIDVVIHPQSIIHSMVCYNDESVLAQMGAPSMKLPIQYALTYPSREYSSVAPLSLPDVGTLTFERPDIETFPCLRLAYEAAKAGGTMPAVMNGANEVCVESFLKGGISFSGIPEIVERVMEKHKILHNPSLEDILNCDSKARQLAGGYINGNIR